MKILIVLGTRPEIIKLSPIIRELARRKINYKLVHTGQHNLESLRKDLGIREFDYVLDLPPETAGKFKGNMFRGIINASSWSLKMIFAIRKVLKKEKPDHLIFQGDTLAIACSAIAGKFKFKRPKLSHVEAGIRTYNWLNPFPEEIARRIADKFSDYLFAPTNLSESNLKKEKVRGKIKIVGNTVVDATLQNVKFAEKLKLGLPKKYGVVFIHRQENVHFKENLENLIKLIENVKIPILFLEHPTAVQKLKDFNLYEKIISRKNVRIMSLQDYLPFLKILKSSFFVLHDSGGVQEESCTLKFPSLVWRKNTERPEAVEAGSSILVGDNWKMVLRIIEDLEKKGEIYQQIKNAKNPFGKGDSGKKIIDVLMEK